VDPGPATAPGLRPVPARSARRERPRELRRNLTESVRYEALSRARDGWNRRRTLAGVDSFIASPRAVPKDTSLDKVVTQGLTILWVALRMWET